MKARLFSLGSIALGLVLLGSTATFGSSTANSAVAHAAKRSVNVLVVGGEWPNLDPATNNEDAADSTEMGAIYGGLFEFGGRGQVIPDLASSYKWANHNTEMLINLRPGVKFTDGTRLTAPVVAWNITRDLLPSNGCICDADFSTVSSISTQGADTVVFHMSSPFASIIEAFQNTAPDWPISEVAYNSEGQATYDFRPVGAGPFELVSGAENSTLTMKANPGYWNAGYPKIENLSFAPIATDTAGLASLQTGQSQVVAGVTTPTLIRQQKSAHQIQVITLPATFYEFVSLNATIGPFNNVDARLALIEATDSKVLVSSLYNNLYTVDQGPSAPGETWYEPKVPGYPAYNLAKAQALVQSLGGLSVTLATTTNTPYWVTEAEALEGLWQQAGIKVTLAINTLAETLTQLKSNTWQALDSNWGGSDPAIAMPTYFGSNGPFTGIHDPVIDSDLVQAATVGYSTTKRDAIYDKIAARMAQNSDAVFMYSKPTFDFASKHLSGIPYGGGGNAYWEYASI